MCKDQFFYTYCVNNTSQKSAFRDLMNKNGPVALSKWLFKISWQVFMWFMQLRSVRIFSIHKGRCFIEKIKFTVAVFVLGIKWRRSLSHVSGHYSASMTAQWILRIVLNNGVCQFAHISSLLSYCLLLSLSLTQCSFYPGQGEEGISAQVKAG